ncbi:hypothetical protein, partial [Pseudomonas aeruginosa]|uniref:hypothetical protein n=1 Tax=Pseudomonas aeruginosa TaxID=287 RepID=UPI00117A6F74
MPAPLPTATLLKKIKERAHEIRQKDGVALHEALDRSAQSFHFADYRQARAKVQLRSLPASANDWRSSLEPLLDHSGRVLVEKLRHLDALADAANPDEYYSKRRIAADHWRIYAASASARELSLVQCVLAGEVSLCRVYFNVVQTAIDLPRKLDRFTYS